MLYPILNYLHDFEARAAQDKHDLWTTRPAVGDAWAAIEKLWKSTSL